MFSMLFILYANDCKSHTEDGAEMIRNLNESLQVPAVSDDLTQCCDDHFLKLNTSKNQTYE